MQTHQNLLVIADDFGLCPGVNQAVHDLHHLGKVDGASLLVNASSAGEAAKIARDNSNLQVGLHLCLVEEPPISDARLLPHLAPAGKLPAHARQLAAQLWTRQIPEGELAIEAEAQLCWMLDHGLKPSHIDSHQHCHVLGPVARIVANLAKRYQIPRVRDLTLCAPALGQQRRLSLIEESGLKMLASAAHSNCLAPFSKTSLFVGLLESGNLTRHSLEKIRNLQWEGMAELMCHPGYEDSAFQNYQHWHYKWEIEADALKNWNRS